MDLTKTKFTKPRVYIQSFRIVLTFAKIGDQFHFNVYETKSPEKMHYTPFTVT